MAAAFGKLEVLLSDKCRVCGAPAELRLGAHRYCRRHYERAVHHRGSIHHADLLSAALLLVFVLAVATVDRLVQPSFGPVSLIVAGVVLALVPAAVWLGFFYRRDRLEPEPVDKVLQLAILGGLLAGAIGIPVVDRVFAVSGWLYSSPLVFLLGSVLVVGATQEFLKYSAVRFWVYDSHEFDELADGVVYGSAAGIGYATALNIAFVVGSGGVDLGLGAVQIVLTALAQASIGGITGYFLAVEKLHHRPSWWVPLGVCLAAVLNGVFFFSRGMLTQGQLTEAGGASNPWIGLMLAVGLIAVVTLTLSRAIRRDIAAALAVGEA